MNKYKKLGKNVLLLTLGNFSSSLLRFLLVPLYTVCLTVEEYGTSDLISTSVNLIIPFLTLLIYESVFRFSLDSIEDRKQIFSIGFWIIVLGCILCCLLSPVLKLFEPLTGLGLYFILYFVSLSLYNLVMQFIKSENVSIYSISGLINTGIYLGLNILFLLVLNLGIKGYLLAFIFSHLFVVLFAFFASKLYRYICFFTKIKFNKVKEMLKYSVPIIPNSISWWISDSSDKYILILFYGVSVNGLYSIAYKIPTILTMMVTIFISAWQISAVDNFGSQESRDFFSDIFSKYEALLFICLASLIAFTKMLSSILFLNEFYEAWVFTPVLLVASLFNSFSAFWGSIYTSAKKTKMLFLSTTVAAALNIILNFILIPRYSAMGAAVATMISYFVIWVIRIIDSRKIVIFDIKYFRIVFSVIVIAIEMFFIYQAESIFSSYALICLIIILCLYFKQLIDILRKFLGIKAV